MIRVIGTVVILAVLAGCPSAGVPMQGAGANPNFPEVTDRLREACWFEGDAVIAALISSADIERESGSTRQNLVNRASSACGTNPNVGVTISFVDCAACGTAVVDHVFGS